MSLHNLAQHLQDAGRHGDSVLVHMSPNEVKGLQALAMAHGGSLTINPKTGLPEAFFLAAILPTIAGIGLKAAGMSALQAALTVGAAGTLATGSLGKGLMMGLGAYGGAGLGEALAGGAAAGAAAAGAGTGSTAASLTQGLSQPQLAAAFGRPDLAATFTPGTGQSLLGQAALNSGTTASLDAIKATLGPKADFAGMTQGVQGVTTPTPFAPPIDVAKTAERLAIERASNPKYLASAAKQPTGLFGLDTGQFKENLAAMGRGLKDVTSDPKKLMQFVKDNPYESASLAASLYNASQQERKMPEQKKGEPLKVLEYEYDPFPIGVAGTSERNYFPNARFTPTGEVYAARGGLMSLAEGGTVEEMSRLNAVGANTMYPMANQMSYKYSTPRQRPISENVVRPEGEARLDPYTGEQKFANGGDVAAMFQAAGLGAPTESQISYWSGVPDAASRIAAAASISKAASATPISTPVSSGVVSSGGVATPTPSPQLRSQIEKLYESELYRPVDSGGLQHYERLFAGGATPGLDPEEITLFRTAGADEFASPEFEARKAAATGAATAKAASEAAAKKAAEEAAAKKTTTGQTSQDTTQAAESRFANTTFKLGSQAPTIGNQTLAASPSQVADIYERVLGRQVDLPGLEYYTRQGRMSPAALEQTLQYSPEFFENLAKPLVPKLVYDQSGRAMIEGGVPYNPAQYGYAGSVVPALPLPKMSATTPTTSGVASLPAGAGAAGAGAAGAANAATAGREISTAPGAYQYNYFENKPEENALIRQFQAGPNEKARADLTELYLTKLGRLPDTPGFDYYMKTIGSDNIIDAKEAEMFMNNAATELADKQALTALYREAGGREADIPGLEYWMSEIGKAGGIEPVKARFLAGMEQEKEMRNAGYSPGMFSGMGSRNTPEQVAQLEAEAPFRYGQYPEAREDLFNLYKNNLTRMPDTAGFNWWLNEIGKDNVISPEERTRFLEQAKKAGETVKMAMGGIANLGGYSDGGRLLKGPGDGVSDSIPAVIGERQPARLADGEFVVPARIVSELGNGSTDAGARKLYAMMDRIQRARKKSVGKQKVAVNSRAEKYLPA